MKIPLLGGAYEARSIIANAQRCVNLYPEQNTTDSNFPTTHYSTSGLIKKSTAPKGGWRCAYVATNGQMFCVVGDSVYEVTKDYSYKFIGVIDQNFNPVFMNDNGITIVIVDGSINNGWTIDIKTNKFEIINDAAFYGSNRVDVVDGYFIFNRPETNQWYFSNFLSTGFNALNFAGKTGYSDLLVCTVVAKRYVYLLGKQTCEIWYNDGGADFTFARMPGAFIEHGCAAVYSAATMDGQIFFLSKDSQGRAIVMKTSNFDVVRISNHAIENEFQTYSKTDDAFGFTFQEGGHYFYQLTFPTVDKTWVFDMATQQWHERAWIDKNGQLHKHRSSCFTIFNNVPLVGDWENGNLYNMTPDAYDDDGVPQVHIRSFPHVINDGARIMYRELIAEMEVGNGIDGTIQDPEVRLRWSDTKGKSWGNAISSGLGDIGQYFRSVQFQRLGYGRDRVFELSWSANSKTALNGVFLEVKQANE